MKHKAIIVDLDGTLCDTAHRQHHVQGPKKDWEAFFNALVHDKPAKWCDELIRAMANSYVEIIFVSGRPEKYRWVTFAWLDQFGLKEIYCSEGRTQYPELHMRKDGDQRKDAIIKAEIYKEHIEPKYEILFCVDDRKQVVDAWRELGLVCLQCAEGNF